PQHRLPHKLGARRCGDPSTPLRVRAPHHPRRRRGAYLRPASAGTAHPASRVGVRPRVARRARESEESRMTIELSDLLKMVFGAFAMWAASREAFRKIEQERDNYKLIAEGRVES